MEESLKVLKENSIHIPKGGMETCWPQFDKEEYLDMSDIGEKFDRAYCTNNSTICFVADHEVFVTPYTREAMRVLRSYGFAYQYFYVPFSNWDYPKYEEAKWGHLLDLAREASYRDYEEDAAKWCDERGIGELSAETMDRCFRIPRSGVPVHHLYFDGVHHPACNEHCIDCTVIERLGYYCSNNGKVAFVYRDGHTYVAKGYRITDELYQAGYRPGNLFVPFSNGEQITDASLAAQWEQLPEA